MLVAMASSGLHSNGYSLARAVLLGSDGPGLSMHSADLGRTIGEELLEPTAIYAKVCLGLTAAVELHAYSHVTGGGLAANLARVLPVGMTAIVDRKTWELPAIFGLIAQTGGVERSDMEIAFNMGVGMIAIVPPDQVDAAQAELTSAGVNNWVIGSVRSRVESDLSDAEAKGGRGGAVMLQGSYRSAG